MLRFICCRHPADLRPDSLPEVCAQSFSVLAYHRSYHPWILLQGLRSLAILAWHAFHAPRAAPSSRAFQASSHAESASCTATVAARANNKATSPLRKVLASGGFPLPPKPVKEAGGKADCKAPPTVESVLQSSSNQVKDSGVSVAVINMALQRARKSHAVELLAAGMNKEVRAVNECSASSRLLPLNLEHRGCDCAA